MNGTFTYKKNGDLRETAKKAGIENIVLETDCPYLPPEGSRGQRNNPAFIPEIAAMVAEEGLYYLKAPILRVCSPDTPVPFSPPLDKAYIPDEKNLLPAIRRLMQYA